LALTMGNFPLHPPRELRPLRQLSFIISHVSLATDNLIYFSVSVY
jgi:hypothetical protein